MQDAQAQGEGDGEFGVFVVGVEGIDPGVLCKGCEVLGHGYKRWPWDCCSKARHC